MQNRSYTEPVRSHVKEIEDIRDIAQRLPVLERAVLGLIMDGYTQVEISKLLGTRKNTVSTIKIRARRLVLEAMNG